MFAQKQINIRDYGVTPGEQDATPGLLQALEDCRKFVGAELIFPQGEYHFIRIMELTDIALLVIMMKG